LTEINKRITPAHNNIFIVLVNINHVIHRLLLFLVIAADFNLNTSTDY